MNKNRDGAAALFFIGTGVMARAIVQNIISSGLIPAGLILGFDRDKNREKEFTDFLGVRPVSLDEGLRQSAIIFLCVKPQDLSALLVEIRPLLKDPGAKLFVSIAAGVLVASIEKALPGAKIVRVMPNLLISKKEGVSALCRNSRVEDSEFGRVLKIFESSGCAFDIGEEHFDAVTAISGSGPAYIFYFAEALFTAAVSNGLPPEIARAAVVRTIKGSGEYMSDSRLSFQELIKKVASKGGTTEKAIDFMDDKELGKIIRDAVYAAITRARELSKLV